MSGAEDIALGPIPYVDLSRQFDEERDELLAVVTEALARGDWVGGAAVGELERALSEFHGGLEAVALNSGTDALALALKGLGVGPGDEVITPANSFFASTAAVVQAGATPVLVDVLPDQNMDPKAAERAITPRTRAIMPVHLTGRMGDMDALMAVAEAHGLKVVEDAAQSIGSAHRGRLAGTIGDAGCFSAHPLKNLNACGDAGFLVTRDAEMAARLRRLRNHGMVDRNTVAEFGIVSRLDTLQAAILLMRLKRLPGVIERRRRNARLYRDLLDPAHVFMPAEREEAFDTHHTFVIQVDRRDELQAHLAAQGIGTGIHYPIPIHLQPAAARLGYREGDFPAVEAQARRILTLPVNQFMTPDDIARVARAVNRFFGSAR
ncbi:DegT/DnrJ/EryC1/StrS family aminotransferase [Azospirillum sp.]|uniref:DegT/DnrJ/EryC1/StrS family aminotransferase n=1 Tax=Azospirillum sp. TaxID=34012 RepID=UPI002D397681|nr:DegT/DnrJ/EryC1/StrS family aminotransferase [Azospirillum sp.]HYD63862.1 DegT/DnrJ/EryC1/StrS family aminotransferase [Azospirillum sp.]